MGRPEDDVPDYLRGVEQDAILPGRTSFQDTESATLRAPRDDDRLHEESAAAKVARRATLIGLASSAGLVLVSMLGAGAVAVSASMLDVAEASARVSGERFAQAALAENRLVVELGARGGDRVKLEGLLASIEGEPSVERSMAAMRYGAEVQNQVVALGDLRGTPVQERQMVIDRAGDAFEADLAHWRSWSANPVGRFAIALGLANAAPE